MFAGNQSEQDALIEILLSYKGVFPLKRKEQLQKSKEEIPMRHFRFSHQIVSLLTLVALLVMGSASPTRAQGRDQTASSTAVRLTPDDHNEIVKAAMDNYKQLGQQLNLKTRKQQGGSKPTGKEVLEAMLQIDGISSHTKELIQKTLQVLPTIENARQRRTPAADRSLAEIDQQLASAQTTEQVAQKLQAMKSSGRYTDKNGLATGIDFSNEMIRKGASTIYWSGNQFYKDISGGNIKAAESKAGGVAKEDAKGAAAGAVAGTIVEPGGGTAAGAAAGAITGSVAECVGLLWDAIFG